MSTINEDADQRKLLDESMKRVRNLSFSMKREMDSDLLHSAFDHTIEMLCELKSNVLTPKNYYELQLHVIDQLRHVEEYFISLHRAGKPIVEFYERIQSCTHIIPRLYLLCCIGGVCIESMEAPAKDILKDLVEMVKGVQHPLRGLFLRSYLTQISKNRLPDVNSPYEGLGGSIKDAYKFLLQNFVETNRLWVRLQSQGAVINRKKRSKDREDLRVLVGANLLRLSQLEGFDVNEYKVNILSKILDEVIACKDTLAQTYLMDCIIHVFPDDFHIATLEMFLQTCTALKEKVNVRAILETLMKRFTHHFSNNGHIPPTVQAFKLFNDCISSIIEERAAMSLAETLKLQSSLSKFALRCFPTRSDYITHSLETCNLLIENSGVISESSEGDACVFGQIFSEIEALLLDPLETLALRVLEIGAYRKMMSRLPWDSWREVAFKLVHSAVKNKYVLSDVGRVEVFFTAVAPLLQDQKSESAHIEDNCKELSISAKFRDEQQIVARCVHLIKSDDTDTLLRIYSTMKNFFTNGGTQRILFTMPPLVFGALDLVRLVIFREACAADNPPTDEVPQFTTRKIFHFIIDIISAIAASGNPEMALKLFLMAAISADECVRIAFALENISISTSPLRAIAYEFFKEALILYETDITDSKAQVRALKAIVGTLLVCSNFSLEDYENLSTKLCQYANKLLKKNDQCQMVALCSHLFWPPSINVLGGCNRFFNEPKMYNRSLECIKRAINIIKENPSIVVFVDILDRCVFSFPTLDLHLFIDTFPFAQIHIYIQP